MCRADEDLVAAARAGDKEAFALLVARHRPLALGLARRLLGQADLAADAAQEATVAALVGLARLRSPERFGAWYAGIALNVARRWLREQARLAPLEDCDRQDGAAGPDERAELVDLAARVRAGVAALAPGQQAAVLAFYWLGLTHAEAAAELGITRGAVKARLHQARAALGPKLAPLPNRPMEVENMSTTTEPNWIEVTVSEVRRDDGDDPARRRHVVILMEREGGRRLPIWTGPPEATALACTLESLELPRPMTYQLAASLVEASGSRVREVRITRLAGSTYYAVVVVESAGRTSEVDARPSDALNLALVSDAPIKLDASMLDDPDCTRTGWEHYPTQAAALVAEVRERRNELAATLAEERPRQDEARGSIPR